MRRASSTRTNIQPACRSRPDEFPIPRSDPSAKHRDCRSGLCAGPGLVHLQRRSRRPEICDRRPDHAGERRQADTRPGRFTPATFRTAAATSRRRIWSATPLFVNDTIYLSTPFYRIFALAPDTGKVKWTYDTKSALKALTQPDLKTRGVAYWQSANPVAGQPCQKIVYIGTMDAKLHAVDADTGKRCTGFANNGVLDINQWNTTNDKWPLSHPAAADRLQEHAVHRLGRQGLGRCRGASRPRLRRRCRDRQAQMDLRCPARRAGEDHRHRRTSGRACRSIASTASSICRSAHPAPIIYGGNRTEKLPLATSVTALDADTGKVHLEPAARPPRHLGLRHQFGAGPGRPRPRTDRLSRPWSSRPSRACSSSSTG